MPSENLQRLQAAYEAFGRGDMEAVMATMDDDIEWVTPDSTPLGGRYHGKREVMAFFGRLAELVQDLTVEPREWIESGDRIVVISHSHGRAAKGELDADLCHVWRMASGRAAEFLEFADTARMNAALGAPVPARAGG